MKARWDAAERCRNPSSSNLSRTRRAFLSSLGSSQVALRLPRDWVWDFWPVRQGRRYHLFYLQAPRALGRPSLRHHNATIGHAVSRDLRTWHILGDAIAPGANGEWDDLATWTGSVIPHQDQWYMLYTGISRSEGGLVQRIGLAVSDDLIFWQKHPANPVLEVDPRWYELLEQGRWHNQSWRDPWLFNYPADEHFHVLITARSPSGPPDGAGVLAHARSPNCVDWEVFPPITNPGEFAQVEVPQLVQLGSSSIILFSCLAQDHSRERVKRLGRPGRSGTFAFAASAFPGPYLATDDPVAGPSVEPGVLYAGKLVEKGLGTWNFMAFRGGDDHEFLGEITDPFPVKQRPNGIIEVLAVGQRC
jgi:beta-fructofuranosidase